ncbi:MAG: lipoyl synthase [Cystobacterineae bacterium]|nr:lipoyl synthase [Cystobacterineae bacterium]
MATSHRLSAPAAGPVAGPKPPWLKVGLPRGATYAYVKGLLAQTRLATVCENSRCPNLSECWSSGTATVLLMGEICTRACKFCHIAVGVPAPLDEGEPEALAQAVKALSLRYVVVTSVDRDDLPDGGAAHFARAIGALRKESPHTLVEVLIPDFQGNTEHLAMVARARPTVAAHNLETVERLTPSVRDRRAGYGQSLEVLRFLKQQGLYTKSSLMLGLGETEEEVEAAMEDLRAAGVDVLTLGQYLQPSPRHLAVQRFITPEAFEGYARLGKALGFLYVASGPLVRSSYKAAEFFMQGLVAPPHEACDGAA